MRKLTRLITAVAATAVMVVCGLCWYNSHEFLPREIHIAAGQKDGLYYELAQKLAQCLHKRTGRSVRVLETAGTEENVRHLRDGDAELALIQNVPHLRDGDAKLALIQAVSTTPEGLAGIAPLYPEILHLLARKGKGIRSPKDLEGRRVALGLRGSSMRQISHTVLTHYQVKNVEDAEEYFGVLATEPGVDAALVTTGWMNPTVEKLLQRGDLELIGIDDPDGLAMRHPWFTTTTIPRGLYPAAPPAPPESVRTVAVTALLACRADASDRLVREALAALYESELRASFPAVLSARVAKDFDAAVMHPSVAMYHNPAAALNRLSGDH